MNECGGCGALIEWGEVGCAVCLAKPATEAEKFGPEALCGWCNGSLYHSREQSPQCPLYVLTEAEIDAIYEQDAHDRNSYDPR